MPVQHLENFDLEGLACENLQSYYFSEEHTVWNKRKVG